MIFGGLLRGRRRALSEGRTASDVQLGSACGGNRVTRAGALSRARSAAAGRTACRRSRWRRARPPRPRRASDLAAEHDHRDRAVALLQPLQQLPAVDARHHDVEQNELGGLLLASPRAPRLRRPPRRPCSPRARGSRARTRGPRVVVDDEDERAGRRSARARAVDEQLEVAAPEAAVAARRVERGHPALVGPLADRRLGDAEELRRLPERQPVRLDVGARLPGELTVRKVAKAVRFLNTRYGLWYRHRDRFTGGGASGSGCQRPDEGLRAARASGCRAAPRRPRSRPRRRRAPRRRRRATPGVSRPVVRGAARVEVERGVGDGAGLARHGSPSGSRSSSSSRTQSSAPS